MAKKITLSRLILFGFIVMILLVLSLSLLSLNQIRVINLNTQNLINYTLESKEVLFRIQSGATEWRILMSEFAMSDNMNERAMTKNQLYDLEEKFEEDLLLYESFITDEFELEEYRAFQKLWSSYLNTNELVLQYGDEGNIGIARNMNQILALPQFKQAVAKLDELVLIRDEEVYIVGHKAEQISRFSTYILLGGSVIAVLLGLGVLILITRQVSEVLSKVLNSSQKTRLVASGASDSAMKMEKFSAEFHSSLIEVNEELLEVVQNNRDSTVTVEQIAHAIGEVASVVDYLSQQAERSSEKAKDAVNYVQSAQSEVVEGNKVVARSNQVTENLRTEMIIAKDALGELLSKISDINNVALKIGELNEQTNLLALNAAIEAARAGEQGRGFAVVAGEVRQLANDSSKSLDDIRQTIQMIFEAAKKAKTEMEHSLQNLEETIICNSNVISVFTKIEAHVQEMALTVNEVMEVIESQAASAEEASASTEEVTASTEEVESKVQASLERIERLKEIFLDLARENDRLKDLIKIQVDVSNEVLLTAENLQEMNKEL